MQKAHDTRCIRTDGEGDRTRRISSFVASGVSNWKWWWFSHWCVACMYFSFHLKWQKHSLPNETKCWKELKRKTETHLLKRFQITLLHRNFQFFSFHVPFTVCNILQKNELWFCQRFVLIFTFNVNMHGADANTKVYLHRKFNVLFQFQISWWRMANVMLFRWNRFSCS